MRPKLNNKHLMAALDEYVTGHTEAKKALIVMLNRSRMRCYQKYHKLMGQEYLLSPLKIMLVGASGTGKTHLLDTLSKVMIVPLLKLDATDLNPTGASKGVKSDELKLMIVETATEFCKLYPKSFEFLEEAIDQTIVYVDEIDKLGISFDSSGNWNRHVQSNFLTTFDNKDELAGVSFVFSGAFSSITAVTEQAKNGMGFNVVEEVVDRETIDDKILRSGLIPELVGRMNSIIELDKFSIDDFVDIINQRIMPKKRIDLAAYGVFNVDLTAEEIKEVALAAVKSGQGVRYAMRTIDKIFMDKEYYAEDYIGDDGFHGNDDEDPEILYLEEML